MSIHISSETRKTRRKWWNLSQVLKNFFSINPEKHSQEKYVSKAKDKEKLLLNVKGSSAGKNNILDVDFNLDLYKGRKSAKKY
jgi:phosphatidate phosphatase PAH1